MESLSAPERETVINMDDESELVMIFTAQRRIITKLRANSAFTEVRSGTHGGSLWAEFTIPTDRFTIGSKRVVTDETRAEMRERARGRGFGRAS